MYGSFEGGATMRVAAGLLCTALLMPFPALAQSNQGLFSNENIGRAVGAVGGALIGSQFGKGSGQLVGVGVGALAGFFLGGEIGKALTPADRQGIDATSQRALETGTTQSWRNPDSGTATTVSVSDAHIEQRPLEAGGQQQLRQAPPLELINTSFQSTGTINVRGGPGTDYVVLDRLKPNERVPVIGRVIDTDWYMIARDGIGRGFVNMPLLRPVPGLADAGQALRPGAAALSPAMAQADTRQCALLTQEVTLKDGTRDAHKAKVCRQPDGSWVEV